MFKPHNDCGLCLQETYFRMILLTWRIPTNSKFIGISINLSRKLNPINFKSNVGIDPILTIIDASCEPEGKNEANSDGEMMYFLRYFSWN